LNHLIGFAYITIKENIKRKSLYGITLIYVLLLLFARFLAEFSLQDFTKFMIDFSYSFLSFFLTIVILFMTTDIMSKDIEKKTIYIILSKGISRSSYIIGRSFSLFILSLLITTLLGTIFMLHGYTFFL